MNIQGDVLGNRQDAVVRGMKVSTPVAEQELELVD
jgi:hypothetical protein